MSIGVLPTYIFVHHTGAVPTESIRCPGTGITHCSGDAVSVLGTEPGSLQKQQVLLATETSLQPQ